MKKQDLLDLVSGKLFSAGVKAGDSLVLAVSGGPDSMALLDVINKLYQTLSIKIVVVHVNHGLRNESKRDEEVVVDYCKKNELKCVVKKVSVKKELGAKGGGIEEKARKLRYRALRQIAQKKNAKYILTAHNSDDQVETIIFNFLRGSSVKGLGGMRELTEDILRPLLGVAKADLLEYVKKQDIPFATDVTNKNLQFTRNNIRHKLLPNLRKFNPNLNEILLRNSQMFQQIDLVLKSMAVHYLDLIGEVKNDKVKISISQLRELLPVIQIEVIKLAIKKVASSLKDLKGIHFREILELLASPNVKASKQLPGKLLASKAYDKITISRITQR